MSIAVETAKATAPAERRLYTYDDLVAEFPESNQPCELWEGEIIMSPTPSFWHQKIALRLYRKLYRWVSDKRLGEVVTAPLDMVLSPHNVTQPDVIYIAKERLHIIKRVIMERADLVAEIISLGGRTRDRIEKRDLYEQYGIKEYWIVDPEAETVDVLSLVNDRYELAMRCDREGTAASRLLPGFEISAKNLFHEDR